MSENSVNSENSDALTVDQKLALEKLTKFMDSSQHVFTLCGYAGTGKTYLIKTFAKTLDLQLLFTAYTGKAVDVLRSRGLHNSYTVHSLIYKPRQNAGLIEEIKKQYEKETTAKKRKELLNKIQKLTNNIEFTLRSRDEIPECDLLVIDEASMISRDIFNDILKLFDKILLVGDRGQLPPVSGDQIKLKPDAELTEIVRQAKGNPIIELASRVRSKLPIYPVTRFASVTNLTKDFDQVLCGMNRTRIKLNQRMRQARFGLDISIYPVPGDRIIILKNDRKRGVFNGQQFEVEKVLELSETLIYIKTTDGIELPLLPNGFEQYVRSEAIKELTPYDYRRGVLADYSYVITVHKSQGSQWERVALIDDMVWKRRQDPSYYAKWAYTAVTRAEKHFECFLKCE